MSRYFSRLVARAAGSVAAAAIAPGPQHEASVGTPGDPFEETAPFEAIPATPPSLQSLTVPPPSPAPVTAPEVTALAPPVRDRVPARAEGPPSVVHRMATVQAEEPSPVVPPAIAPPLPRPIPPQLVAERAEIPAVTPPTRPLALPDEKPVERERKRDAEPVQRSPFVPPPAASRVLEPPLKKEELPREPRRRGVPYAEREQIVPLPPVIIRETTQQLEPPRLDPVAAAVPPLESPRLVIGRLYVEVVPAPQSPAAPQVVRSVERRPSSGRAATPSSQLRFGLGQM